MKKIANTVSVLEVQSALFICITVLDFVANTIKTTPVAICARENSHRASKLPLFLISPFPFVVATYLGTVFYFVTIIYCIGGRQGCCKDKDAAEADDVLQFKIGKIRQHEQLEMVVKSNYALNISTSHEHIDEM